MPRILLFDVNETMLDLKALDPHFARVFGDAAVRGQWFSTMLRYSFTVTLTNNYRSFSELGGAALDTVATVRGRTLTPDDRQAILGGMRQLPAHPDVLPALEKLHAASFRMATLTNSPPAAVAAQLEFAGLTRFFEQQLSVDSVGAFKPAHAPYAYAAEVFGVEINQLRLIATHDWDVAGALAAGCAAAFVQRPGTAPFPVGPQPDIVAPDLLAVAERILTAEAA